MKNIFKKSLLLLALVLCLTGCEDNSEKKEAEKNHDKGAVESSALGYIDAVEKQVLIAEVDTTATKIPAGTYTVSTLTDLKVDVKGEEPAANSIVIINYKGAVEKAWIEFDDYDVYFDGKKAIAVDKDETYPVEPDVPNCNYSASSNEVICS